MKPLVIYHANCTDGFGAAFAAWLKLGDEAEYLPMEYGHSVGANLPMFEGREVYILDFSFPKPDMVDIFAEAKLVTWLDHHKTAFEMWTGRYVKDGIHIEHDYDPDSMRPWVTLDDTKSGAMLAWEHFHPGTEVPMLIQHIDDRDRWQFKMDGSKELHAALSSYRPWTFEQWWRLFYDKPGLGTYKRADMILEGTALLRAHSQQVQSALKQARLCQIVKPEKQRGRRVEPPWSHGVSGPNHPGYFDEAYVSGLAANAPPFWASDLGHELANKSGTFGLVWSMAGDGQIHCSLRSNGDYDVSEIAKAFGGGGHRNAAGFSTDIDTLMGWIK